MITRDATVTVVDLKSGWPTTISIECGDKGPVEFSVHASLVGSHARGVHEFRFQNPGNRKPVEATGGSYPVLLGIWKSRMGEPVFVGVEGVSRVGRDARFSILFNGNILTEAVKTGWATYVSSTGERITAFSGNLAPVFFEAIASSKGDVGDLSEIVTEVQRAITEEAANSAAGEVSTERARYLATRIARSSSFSRKVFLADEYKCVLCGIEGPLLQAAHIHPVSALDSSDSIENGLTLCANHHLLFDSHNLAIRPGGKAIVFSPAMEELTNRNPPIAALVQHTAKILSVRSKRFLTVSDDMLKRRLAFYSGKYDWLK
jgi:hypothetical protein